MFFKHSEAFVLNVQDTIVYLYVGMSHNSLHLNSKIHQQK